MTAFDQQTLEFYAAEADGYVSCRPDDIEEDLPSFLDLLPPAARILELGCGGGANAAYMIGRGFNLDLTDGVAAMASKAEERLGRPVRVMRFDELEAIAAYDAVVANASLLHVPIDALSTVLAKIWQALRPGGWHLATYKTANVESRDKHGRYYNYLDREDAAVRYASAGKWASVEYDERAGIGYFSEPAMWLKVIARKAGG